MRLARQEERLRLRTMTVPKGAVKVTPKGLNLTFYLYTAPTTGQPCALCFRGSAGRPSWWLRFRNDLTRQNSIATEIEGARKIAAFKAERKAADAKPNTYQVGQYLVTCWGYEQTNREFFKIIERTDHTLKVVEVEKIDASKPGQPWMTGAAVPGEKTIGAVLTVRTRGNHVRVEGHYASLWEGRPVEWTAYH